MPYQAELYYFEHRAKREDRPPLVLIHGAAGTHLSWPPQIRRMPDRTVLAIDLPGHGRSAGGPASSIAAHVQVLCAWLDGLGIRSAVLTGHSMGAAIALVLALDYPRRVGGLALLGAGASLRVHPNLLEKSSNPAAFDEAVRLITRWSFSKTSPRRLTELVERRMAETAPEVLYGDLMACDSFDVRERLPEIACPVQVICGAEDRMTPLRESRFLAEKIPAGSLVIIPGCGHMAMLERPEVVAQALETFFARSDAGNPSGLRNEA